MIEFDFGPISRTVDASTGKGDAINFASLPIHEAMTALLAGNSRDEFVAWLWHDLFKPLFWWPQRNRRNRWFHFPNNKANDPLNVEAHWSEFMGIPSGLVETHHYSKNRVLEFTERETVNNEFDQVTIGRNARFLQLAFLAEPAMNAALLRAVIADAFMEVVTKAAAKAIEKELVTGQPTFRRVRYVFDFKQKSVSMPPTAREIEALRDNYDMRVQGDELIIEHLIPVRKAEFSNRHVEVVVDFTDAHPTPEGSEQRTISLVELLTVYQDSRTILMGLPQFLQIDIQQLKQQVKDATERRLQALDVLTVAAEKDVKGQAKTLQKVDWSTLPLKRQGQEIDLLAHVFDEQVEFRLIERGQLTQKVKVGGNLLEVRWLNDVISWPIQLLQSKPRCCRFCNTAFDSAFPPADARVKDVFSGDFTDIEHVGFEGDVCPMCRIYALNNKFFKPGEKAQGKSGARKAYRGSFASLAPSSHFTYAVEDRPMERPLLDIGGRFAAVPQRATVTLQEFALFNLVSRRIIGQIWKQLNHEVTRSLPLPYLGAILLTERDAQQIRALFDQLEMLFDEVVLWAYPFRIVAQPAVEIAFEMAVNDKKQHLTKHTYLKTSPTIVSVALDSKFTVLVDNGLQLEVSRQFFEDRKRVDELLGSIRGQERRRNWFLAILQGEDPVTATAETFYDYGDQGSLRQAEKMFWDAQLSAASFPEQWRKYEEVRDEIRRIVAKYPMLIEFFVKPRRR